jgi:hypothetical protein
VCIAGLTVNNPTSDALTVFGFGKVNVRGFMFKQLAVDQTSPVQDAINGAINNISESLALSELNQQYYEDYGVNNVQVWGRRTHTNAKSFVLFCSSVTLHLACSCSAITL